MLRNIVSNELFTLLFVVGLIFVATAKLLFSKRFKAFINIFGSFKYLKIYSRDQKILDGFDVLLFVNFLISSSIFIYLVNNHNVNLNESAITILIKLFVGIGFFVLSKILIERLIGSLFYIDKIVASYVFQKTSYKFFLGLLLLPINALLIYSLVPTTWIFNTVILFLIILNCIGIIGSYKTHLSSIKPNLFYFILYLCALEISPYVILYKYIINT